MSLNLNIYVFTTRYVMNEYSSIVRVLHDEDGVGNF